MLMTLQLVLVRWRWSRDQQPMLDLDGRHGKERSMRRDFVPGTADFHLSIVQQRRPGEAHLSIHPDRGALADYEPGL